MIYLDNAATTKPCQAAVEGVLKGLENFGNPSSLHKAGLEAEILLRDSRTKIAKALGCLEEEIFFTSGATEGNNTAILGAFSAKGRRLKKIVTTSVEHPSVENPCGRVEQLGGSVVRVSPDEKGKISAEKVLEQVDENTCMVSCMMVNNEIGAVMPAEEIFSAVKKKFPHIITHCDCVQGFMKIPINWKKLKADIICLSGHKIYAPKGVGAMYVKKGVHISPLILGGGQEREFRSGTESVPLIAAFANAVEQADKNFKENYSYVKKLEEYLFERCSMQDYLEINCKENKSPYINSIWVKGIKAEVLLHFLEEKEIYVSSGSACSKGKKSRVLQQFGLTPASDSTIRVSFSPDNTTWEIDRLMDALEQAQKQLIHIVH